MIIPASQEHLGDIMEIWLNTNISAHFFIPQTYWKKVFAEVAAAIPASDLFICYEDKTVKGFIGVIGNKYIAGLFVSEKHQSQGIGKRLLDFCKQRYPYLELDVFAENGRAVRFYQNNGFEIAATKMSPEFQHKEHRMVWAG